MAVALDDVTNERDRLLVQRFRAGDLGAFEELYRTYHRQLLAFVRRRVRERHIAEDLTHDTFARALVGMDQLRDPARFYPWLTVIARHLVINHYRAARRLSPLTDADAGSSEAPELLMLRRLEQEVLHTALGRVRGRHREVLTLQLDEDLSYEAIAERMGTTATTIPGLLHRARLALRREYMAIVEAESLPALFPWSFGIWNALRRLRDRLLQTAAYLPDATAMSGSIAAVAISIGSMLPAQMHSMATALGAERADPVGPGTGAVTDLPASPSSSISTAPDLHPHDSDRQGDLSSATRYRPDLTLDQDERRRRQGDRHMPYGAQVGPTWVGVDPDQMQRDIESSLAGDYGWMEG